MTRKQRYEWMLDYFRKKMPEVQTELEFGSEFQLLVAVMLSAQCTDKRINQVTPELFRRFPDARSMAQVEADEVLEYIKSVSYPNAKADHLVKMARIVAEQYGGEIPYDMDQLLTLPGVGRKTANVVQSVAFGKATLAVDTRAHHWLLLHGRYVCTARKPHCERCDLSGVCPSADRKDSASPGSH